MPKAFLVDTTRCTACRGCQMACKDWHNLPSNATKQTGSHQNPPDLNPYNYKLVRFFEHLDDAGTVHWNFFPDQCRHCTTAPCVAVADSFVEGAFIQDEATGAVVVTPKAKELSEEDSMEIKDACPYNIPRWDAKEKTLTKCDMCIDRVQAGMQPMCVKSCPTGAMAFGEREEILKLAEARLEVVKKEHPKAFLANPDDVSVIYLLAEEAEMYYEFAAV